jgi:hypothetical protein
MVCQSDQPTDYNQARDDEMSEWSTRQHGRHLGRVRVDSPKEGNRAGLVRKVLSVGVTLESSTRAEAQSNAVRWSAVVSVKPRNSLYESIPADASRVKRRAARQMEI